MYTVVSGNTAKVACTVHTALLYKERKWEVCVRHCGFTLLNLFLWISYFALAVVKRISSLFNHILSSAEYLVMNYLLIVITNYKEYERKLLWYYIWVQEYRKATKNLVEPIRYPVLQSKQSPVE
jgi:hypothetical protein